jgi:hypothetical protein
MRYVPMARYKATILFDVPDNDSRSAIFQNISRVYDQLGGNVRTRRALHYNLLDDIQDDIETRLTKEMEYDLKDRTATYEIVSWEQLPR